MADLYWPLCQQTIVNEMEPALRVHVEIELFIV